MHDETKNLGGWIIQMKYDAFISYRHGELDSYVAERLHKMLEVYQIPNPIAKKIGKKKLTRIFRDREELPTSSNLSDSINDALENSAFLLLICSRRTCQSMWVMREVERFGELHGKDKIITLLIDGEPDESFPPGLREREIGGEIIFVEPLAADIRSDTWAGSIKLLKEEKLRLLAPILHCSFDDLRRRHRQRRIRRIVLSVSVAFIFSLSFGGFSTWQYWQIDRQMQLKLENQSHVLAEYSASRLADGDPDTAMLLALAALPVNLVKPERPLVPAAEKALVDAVGIYDVTGGYKPHKAIVLPAAPGTVLLSPEERYAAVIYPYELKIFDSLSGKTVAVLPTLRSALADAVFLTDEIIVFTGEDGIVCYDILNGLQLWRGDPASVITVSEDHSVIAAVYKDEPEAALYASDGQKLGAVSFGGKSMALPVDDSFLNPHNTVFSLSGEGKKLAVSFSNGSMSVFDVGSSWETPIYPTSGAFRFSGGFYKEILVFSVVENEPYYSCFVIYDTEADEPVATYESDSSPFVLFFGQDGLYMAFGDQIMSVDTNTGEVFYEVSAGNWIEAFCKFGDIFLVGDETGSYSFISNGMQTYQSEYVCHFLALGNYYAMTGSYDSRTVRVLRKDDRSGAGGIFSYDKTYVFSEARVHQSLDRAVFYSYNGMRLYDLAGNLLAETLFPDPFLVRDTQYDKISGNIIVLYEDTLRIYSGLDGSLLLVKQGMADASSVIYTTYGVSVLEENGDLTLYDPSTCKVLISAQTTALSDFALPLGDALLTSDRKRIYFNGFDLGEGEYIGAGKINDGFFVFAVSDGVDGKVYTVKNSLLSESFSFQTRGRAEAYFSGGYVFISPLHGDACAYTLDGELIRTFSENSYMAETGELGEYIVASYASSSIQRYTLLLDPDSLETVAVLPGFLCELADGTLILDDRNGNLHSVRLLNTQELMDIANELLDGRELTPEEIIRFNTG